MDSGVVAARKLHPPDQSSWGQISGHPRCSQAGVSRHGPVGCAGGGPDWRSLSTRDEQQGHPRLREQYDAPAPHRQDLQERRDRDQLESARCPGPGWPARRRRPARSARRAGAVRRGGRLGSGRHIWSRRRAGVGRSFWSGGSDGAGRISGSLGSGRPIRSRGRAGVAGSFRPGGCIGVAWSVRSGRSGRSVRVAGPGRPPDDSWPG
jgi:hypothetical protein